MSSIDEPVAEPGRVFEFTEVYNELRAGPVLFASHEAARGWAAETYGTTERGWWKQAEGCWRKRIKQRVVVPRTGVVFASETFLFIKECEVHQ